MHRQDHRQEQGAVGRLEAEDRFGVYDWAAYQLPFHAELHLLL